MIGKRLKQLRDKTGFTQQQVSEKTGISRGSISHHENDTFKPNDQDIVKYAIFYSTTTDYILGKTSHLSKDIESYDLNQLKAALEYIEFTVNGKPLSSAKQDYVKQVLKPIFEHLINEENKEGN